MELILLCAGVFLGYFIGVNVGYRLKVREGDNEHCAVLFLEQHQDNLLFFDYITKEFKFQCNKNESLSKKIREEVPQDNVVIFNLENKTFLAMNMTTGKCEGLHDSV